MIPADAKRILILGQPGSGKSTLARQLANQHRIPHIEVDLLYWQIKKGGAIRPDFRAELEKRLAHESWILEGHYRKIENWIPTPDHVITLTVPIPTLLLRLALRDLREFATGDRVTSDFWLVLKRMMVPNLK